uniref:Taste receptor type 2 n=1 Tax=Panagrolaimus davidi TaxID=227884 RepID=A0A914PGB9_9BILA
MPKSAKIYKWLLTSCIITSTICTIVRFLALPFPTLPLMGVYSAGWLSSFGPKATLICLNIYFVCIVNTQLCTTFCLIYQYSAIKPFSWISSFGYCPRRVTWCYCAYLFSMATILTILIQMSYIEQKDFEIYANKTNNFYALELIKQQPSWIGFSSDLKPIVTILFVLFATIPDLLIAIFAITLTIKLYFIIKADKAHVSHITRGLEKNLYYTFLFRTFCIIFMYSLPYLGIVLTIFFKIQNPKLGIYFHSIIILLGFTCLCGTLVMIKPFRIFIFGRCFGRKVSPSGSTKATNSSTSSDASLPISITFESFAPLPKSKRSI